MKKTVKPLSLFTLLFVLSGFSHAQLIKISPAAGSPFADDVKKVVEDFHNSFANLTGEPVKQNPQSADYECGFRVTGAEECFITVYSSGKRKVCSWQALMLTTEDFGEAKKKYKALHSQLNNIEIKDGYGVGRKLRGSYEAPWENKKFTSSVLTLHPAGEQFQKLIVEISIQYEPMEWKVKVQVYEKEREDDERGKIIEY
jgi:hypothetical protein